MNMDAKLDVIEYISDLVYTLNQTTHLFNLKSSLLLQLISL